MHEHVLRGNIELHPRAEGGRNLVVRTGADEFFRVPMDAATTAAIGAAMVLGDEEFAEEMVRRERASRLAVVGNGHPSN